MIEINLLGKAKTKGTSKAYKNYGKSNLFVIIFAIFIIIEVATLSVFTLYLNNRVETLTQQKNRLKNVAREVKSIKAELKKVKLMTATIKNLEKNRGVAYKNLKNIADVMPDGLWLTKVSKKKKMLKLEGKSFTTEAIAQYMTNLGVLSDVDKVSFDSRGLVRLANKKGVDIYKFYIAVKLKD